MKLNQYLTAALLGAAIFGLTAGARAEEAKKEVKKPYPLKVCIVSDEKLGEMGDPFVFKHEGKEIQLCCKSCQKDFTKDPAKYLKKMAALEKKAAAGDKKGEAEHKH